MTKLSSITDIPLHFPSLECLDIYSCNKLESLFDGEPNQVVELPSLKEVTIRGCNAMEWFLLGNSNCNADLELPSLEIITIKECPNMRSFSTRPLKAPKLRKLEVSNCPEMEWFLLANSNCAADLELPSLEKVTIKKCPNMKSFSPAVLRAPKLQLVKVDDKPYPIAEIEDFNHFLQSANSNEQTAADKNDS